MYTNITTVICPSPSHVENGVTNCTKDQNYFYEDTCNYTCHIGYILNGTDTMSCQSNGSWSGRDNTCEKGQLYKWTYSWFIILILVFCSSLNDFENGVINCVTGDDGILSYGDSCNLTCNTGYKITGNVTRICQSDGNWSSGVANCMEGQLYCVY